MKKFIQILVLLPALLVLNSNELTAQDVTWMKSKNSSEGISIAVDPAGNLYIIGTFRDSASFGSVKLISLCI